MEKITVAKAELLAALQQNRDDHRRIFEEALEGFQANAVAELERWLADIRAGKRSSVVVRLPVPVDHTADYNRAIKMVEMSINATVSLSETDFAQYVMDDWGWQTQFLSNTYGSATAQGKFSETYAVS